jgi:hypothetical protein
MKRRPGRKALGPFARIEGWISSGKLAEDPSTGCWLWSGAISCGYGSINMSAKTVGDPDGKPIRHLLHRWMYELHVGPIPDGLDLDHLCRVRNCCNPWHLEPVTRSVNILRAVGVGSQWSSRTHCSAGHEYTDENTARSATDGSRVCRECSRETSRRYAARKAADRYTVREAS